MASRTLGLYSQASNTLATAFHNAYFASGGGGGSQTLAQTLVNGNTTGGTDIIQTSGDSFKSSSNSDLKLELDGNGKVLIEQNGFSGNAFPMMKLVSIDNNNVGATLEFYQDNSAVASNDELVSINFKGNSLTTNEEIYANIGCFIDDPTFSSMNAHIRFLVRNSGTLGVPLDIFGNYVKPIALMDSLSTTGQIGQILSCNNSGTGALKWISPFTNMTATGGVVNTYYEGFTRYTSHTFLSNGSFTITSYGNNVVPEIDMLIIGGGGQGGSGNGLVAGGGGGAGCCIQITGFPLLSSATLPDATTITIGNGGSGAVAGATGTVGGTTTVALTANIMMSSIALSITAPGGGGGAGSTTVAGSGVASSYTFTTTTGSTTTTITPTSSGGGGSQGTGASTSATTSVFNSSVGDLYGAENVRAGGYRGASGSTVVARAGCSGGGASNNGGQPGSGIHYVAGSSLGYSTYWGGSLLRYGGGGIGGYNGTVVVNPASALYGGGIGEATAFTATAGTANTGSGGGGAFSAGTVGASGGSGIVIIRYKS